MRVLKAHILALAITAFTSSGLAQQWPWSADDFEPLTSLPWKKGDPSEQVITRIFREPRVEVRHAVLDCYLRSMPLKDFDAALTLCAKLEGRDNPDDMIELVLSVWARRDPMSAWRRTQELFGACVIQGHPLSLDSWNRPRITVANLDAIRKSPFWLNGPGSNGSALTGFAIGVNTNQSDENIEPLSRAKRREILQAFTHRYIELFAAAPSVVNLYDGSNAAARKRDEEILQALSCEHNDLTWIKDRGGLPPVVYDVAAIRWLTKEPWRAEHILEKTTEQPSLWFLQMWKRLDLDAMKVWAEASTFKDGSGADPRGMLMSKVDAATRLRWLAEERQAGVGGEDASPLLNAWAVWNPQDVVPFLATLKPETPIKDQTQEEAEAALRRKVGEVLDRLVYTNDPMVWNRCSYGMKFLADADWKKLPAFMTRSVIEENGLYMMEQWSDVNVGQAARFSFKLITSAVAQDIFPRAELIKEFAGGEPFSRDDFNDRCFCALRFWAMWKPDEMKAWIATVEGEDMRKALTWLLEHPWGTGPGPE